MARWLAIGFAAFMVSTIFVADVSDGFGDFVTSIPLGDKIGHFVLMGILTLLVNLAVWQSGIGWKRSGVLGVSLVVAVVVTGEEFSQQWLPRRTFSWVDLIYDYLGIACFGLLATWIIGRSRPKGGSEDVPTDSS